jgi:hypothetical protein
VCTIDVEGFQALDVARVAGRADPAEVCMRRGCRVFGLAAMLTVVIIVPCEAEEDAGADWTLQVEQSTIDLGEIGAGTEAVAEFVIHNTGDRDARILRAKPS